MASPRGIRDVEIADEVFSSLAHPARRQILLAVHYRGSCNAGDIARRFECSWPTTSRHLATLVKSGLLEVSKRGRERIYSANARLIHDVLDEWGGFFAGSE